jgi:hypothetical protein
MFAMIVGAAMAFIFVGTPLAIIGLFVVSILDRRRSSAENSPSAPHQRRKHRPAPRAAERLAPMPENRNRMLPGPPLRRLTRRRQNMASRPRNSSTRPGKIAPATVSAVQRASLFDAGAAAARQKLKMVGEVDVALARRTKGLCLVRAEIAVLSRKSNLFRSPHLSPHCSERLYTRPSLPNTVYADANCALLDRAALRHLGGTEPPE